jgi:drug/metabolite transporter (DMT)-like permease
MDGGEAPRPAPVAAPAPPAPLGYPAWQWLVAGMVMFLISVPVASGVVLSSGTPPVWAAFLSFLGIAYWGFLLLMTPHLAGSGLGALMLMLVWPLFPMVGALILERMEQKKWAGIVAIMTGVLFLPSGVLNVFAGLAYFREAKAQAGPDVVPAKAPDPVEAKLDPNLTGP